MENFCKIIYSSKYDCRFVLCINTSHELNGSHLLQVWQTFDTQVAEHVGPPSFEKSTSNIRKEKYQCPECSYTCSKPSQFTKHYRTHTGEKPFSCTECTYQTSDKSNLTKHIRIHSGERRFPCSYCSFCSNRKDRLLAHERTHN